MSDKRVEKTIQLIEKNFLFLTEEKSISKISVTEICTMCNINRCTFYTHFLDIYDLVEKLEQKVAKDLFDIFDQYEYDAKETNIVELLLQTIKNNHDLFLLIFNDDSSGHGWRCICDKLEAKTIPIWLKKSDLSEKDAHLVFLYMMNGTFVLLKEWYQNNCTTNIDEMSLFIENLTKYGTYHYLYTKK